MSINAAAVRYENFRVTEEIVPTYRDPWTVETFDVDSHKSALSYITSGGGVAEGTYTRLLRVNDSFTGDRRPGIGQLWMSDTPSEYRDHVGAIYAATGRVLINGLGLGCVLKAMLAKPEVEHVDVVECDAQLVALMCDVAPWLSDPRVTIHVADAYEQAKVWPVGTTWDVAWHDIWSDKCGDDLAAHARLSRSYGRRVGWQGCWAHDELLYARRRDSRWSW